MTKPYKQTLEELPKLKPLPQGIKEELYLITCALGFLSAYAQENEKEEEHPVYYLIRDLSKIVRLYKSRYNHIIKESFDIFDDVVGDEKIIIDTVAFSNALLLFHSKIKKHFHPNQKAVQAFWMEYKKANKECGKDEENSFKNSRNLALQFFERL